MVGRGQAPVASDRDAHRELQPGAAAMKLRNQEGFTLLEILVAVAILAMISALVWYTFAQVFKTIDIVRADSDLLRMVRQVTSRVPSEMSSAYLPVNLTSPTSVVKYEFVADD